MTVYSDLQRAIAMAEASKGSYLLFATDSEDQKAQQVFQQMAEDMDRHVTILQSRLDYLSKHNQLNAGGQNQGQDQGNGQNGGQGNEQKKGAQQQNQAQGAGQAQGEKKGQSQQNGGQGGGQ